MKKLITIFILMLSFTSVAQYKHNNTKGEIDTQTNTSKTFQGALTATAIYITMNSLQRGENKLLTYTTMVLGSLLIEGLSNSKETNFEKMAFVGAGAVTVTVTFEIFKPKHCNRHNY